MPFFKKLNNVLTKKDRKYLSFLFLFTLVIACIETLGVSVIMPFMSVANDQSLINTNMYYRYFYDFFAFEDKTKFVIIFGAVILVFYFIRAFLNSIYIFVIMHFINSRYDLIANKLFQRYLSLPYKYFMKQNTSSLTKVIINEVANITEIFWFFLLLISELLVLFFIYMVLMYINYKITLALTITILMVGFLIKKVISKKMHYYGIKREEYQRQFYEILNKSFNNIKMLKLHSSAASIDEFSAMSKKYVNTKIISGTLQQLPRFILEFIGFSLIVLIVIYYLLSHGSETGDLLSLVSVFILGLYRILPSITKIFLSYNTILFQYKSLDIIYKDLNLEIEEVGNEEVCFKNAIQLKNISFAYDQKNIIENLSFELKKNEKIAFIGESGSGKSTLVDIIMGLHQVTSGDILVDGTKISEQNLNSWRQHFGYIPQSVYLFDGTVAENIAFGLDIDEDKMTEVLTKSNIWEFLKDKDGLDTYVGESGVMLSGGQKQRIAIARALYQDPDVLVLDEATSALDEATEAKIMEEVYKLAEDKTLIIIAHRLSTIRRCDKVYRVDRGEIISV